MLPPSSLVQPRTWRRKDEKTPDDSDFFISTDPKLISIKAVNDACSMDFLYWAKPFPDEILKQIIAGSLCFGVYKHSPQIPDNDTQAGENNKSVNDSEMDDQNAPKDPRSVEQVGFARLITDTVTFAYLTDVYILPAYQSYGLGSWLVECIAETLSASNMPYMRRVMLVAEGGKKEGFYANMLGVQAIGKEERPEMGKSFVILGRRGGVPSKMRAAA
ncbi:hypothetical protein Plec18167_006292 [Paecilomyces lecythidis]|uniref:N-acetyltransferase domain-containing protein n=1 Tax=Paecilomyces lecythidis TaxID=3004212 RepID=A0ABR3XCW5_9EURO